MFSPSHLSTDLTQYEGLYPEGLAKGAKALQIAGVLFAALAVSKLFSGDVAGLIGHGLTGSAAMFVGKRFRADADEGHRGGYVRMIGGLLMVISAWLVGMAIAATSLLALIGSGFACWSGWRLLMESDRMHALLDQPMKRIADPREPEFPKHAIP